MSSTVFYLRWQKKFHWLSVCLFLKFLPILHIQRKERVWLDFYSGVIPILRLIGIFEMIVRAFLSFLSFFHVKMVINKRFLMIGKKIIERKNVITHLITRWRFDGGKTLRSDYEIEHKYFRSYYKKILTENFHRFLRNFCAIIHEKFHKIFSIGKSFKNIFHDHTHLSKLNFIHNYQIISILNVHVIYLVT